jgi:hypothetical protein
LHWRPEDIVFVEDSEMAGASTPSHEESE